jgi:hypothetical protein
VPRTLCIPLTDEHLAALRQQAARLGVQVEDLARAGVLDLIARSEDRFEHAVDRVLKKNAELYKRLG